MRELQKSFLRRKYLIKICHKTQFFQASINMHVRMRIKHVLTGSNYSTECCREPEEWGGYLGIDKTLFSDIRKKFGTSNIDRLPVIDILHYRLWVQIYTSDESPFTSELYSIQQKQRRGFSCKGIWLDSL